MEKQLLVYDPRFGYILNNETVDYILIRQSATSIWSERHPALKEVIEQGYATVAYRYPYVEDAGAHVRLELTEKGKARVAQFADAVRIAPQSIE